MRGMAAVVEDFSAILFFSMVFGMFAFDSNREEPIVSRQCRQQRT